MSFWLGLLGFAALVAVLWTLAIRARRAQRRVGVRMGAGIDGPQVPGRAPEFRFDLDEPPARDD
jgi:hypothetical protein